VIDNQESLAYVLGDSGAEILLIDSLARWRPMVPFASRFPRLPRIIFRDRGGIDGEAATETSLQDWLARVPEPQASLERG
jgi:hypothetical protein